jgi:hypothetical protein
MNDEIDVLEAELRALARAAGFAGDDLSRLVPDITYEDALSEFARLVTEAALEAERYRTAEIIAELEDEVEHWRDLYESNT